MDRDDLPSPERMRRLINQAVADAAYVHWQLILALITQLHERGKLSDEDVREICGWLKGAAAEHRPGAAAGPPSLDEYAYEISRRFPEPKS